MKLIITVVPMLGLVAAGYTNSFCLNADNAFECLYPCGGSVVGGFDCAAKNKTWTCEPWGPGQGSCKYSTHCTSHGLFCNATTGSSWTECNGSESSGPPFDGGCGCGCASSACGGPTFAQPPIDPSNPFVKPMAKIGGVLRLCIVKPKTLYKCNAGAPQGQQCAVDPQGTLTDAQCKLDAEYKCNFPP